MKIQPVTFSNLAPYYPNKKIQEKKDSTYEFAKTVPNINNISCYYNISFGAIQNSSKLRALFAYRLPCIYSGVPMIDPKLFGKWMKNSVFTKPSAEFLNILKPYEDAIDKMDMEYKVLELIKERSKIHPDRNIKQLLEELKPVYCRRLRKKQTPVFHELTEYFKTLPPQYNTKFKFLMEDALKKLDHKPVVVPFSSYEFKYKLSKIANDIDNGTDIKAKKVMRKLMKESKRFSNTTSESTLQRQKDVLKFLRLILKKSVLKNNEQLRDLIAISQSRLNKDEVIVPFLRKNFIYDLLKITEDLGDKKVQNKIFDIAEKLPTSQDSFSAYMMKLLSEPCEKIGHRIIWPYIASVEHLWPRSVGGPDLMKNFAGATTRENSRRQSIEFTRQLKLKPNTPKYCQMYVDRLVELNNQGVFKKIGLNPRYITDFRDTIYELSQHRVKLVVPDLNC